MKFREIPRNFKKFYENSRNFVKLCENFVEFSQNFVKISWTSKIPSPRSPISPFLSSSAHFFTIFAPSAPFFFHFRRLRRDFFLFFFLHFWRLRRQFALFRTPICSFSILAPWVLDLSIIVSSAHRNTYTTVPQHHHYLTPSYSRFPWSPQYLSHGPLPNLLTDHQLPT